MFVAVFEAMLSVRMPLLCTLRMTHGTLLLFLRLWHCTVFTMLLRVAIVL
jgi:hypothetical protein